MVFITPDDSKEKANVATYCWAVIGSGPPPTLIPDPQEAISTVHVIYMAPVKPSRYKQSRRLLSTQSAGGCEVKRFPRG
ncbi:hypothetical protein BOTNAR_1255g00020 [Botryotinia narcissicola]|uniref:Uncharacterized protein n=1 Tax=Botryotinia narcissicola TaxID=278944 RepID=A0A4Z1H3S7_9HELO|nr:hypothetical protein BOTNAR_1255g00020 [Botryotinia narcissicola]